MLREGGDKAASLPVALIGFSVEAVFAQSSPAAVLVDTVSGRSARNVTRFRLPAWILARTPQRSTCRQLQLSYGVHPFLVAGDDAAADPRAAAGELLGRCGIPGDLAVHVEGPSLHNPDAIHRISLYEVRRAPDSRPSGPGIVAR